MSREAHVRFCESVAVRSRRATRPVAESFFLPHAQKVELIHTRLFHTRQEARTEIFDYIAVLYLRLLGLLSTAEFEEMAIAA